MRGCGTLDLVTGSKANQKKMIHNHFLKAKVNIEKVKFEKTIMESAFIRKIVLHLKFIMNVFFFVIMFIFVIFLVFDILGQWKFLFLHFHLFL